MRKGDKVTVYEVEVRDGPKGVSFKFFSKSEEKTIKYLGKQKPDGSFFYMADVDGKKDSKESVSRAGVVGLISGVRGLEKAVEYLSGGDDDELYD